MIIETTYSQHDLRKKCYNCKWLKLDDNSEWLGTCVCEFNRVKDRRRQITDKSCSWKNADKYKGVKVFEIKNINFGGNYDN
jgi:hypothetical protein